MKRVVKPPTATQLSEMRNVDFFRSEFVPGGSTSLLERLPALLRARRGGAHARVRQEVARLAQQTQRRDARRIRVSVCVP